MRTPFSMAGPPGVQRSAVGEGGYHLPSQPTLYGEDAVNSVRGYYPTKRMDSILDPQRYQAPSQLRATTMPHTKAADLREKYARFVVDAIRAEQSEFVQGFLIKCAEAQLPPVQLLQAIVAAMNTHPHIAREFEKCGMLKQAIGSTNGLGSLLSGPKPAAPALPKPPVPSPIASPSRGSMLTGKLPAPATPPPVAPKPQMHIPEGPSVGFGSGLSQGVKNVGGAIWGGAKGGTAASLGMITSPARLLGAGPRAFNDSLWQNARAGGQDVVKAFNPYEATKPGSYNSALVQKQQQQLANSGEGMQSRLLGTADNIGYTATNLAAGGGAGSGIKMLAQGAGKAIPGMSAVGGAISAGGRVANSPTAGLAVTGSELAQPSVDEVVGRDEFGNSKLPVSASGAIGKFIDSPAQRESAITANPKYNEIAGLVEQDPEQASQLADQAKQQLAGSLETPEGQAEAAAAAKNGTLSPEGQQKAVAALTGEGYDWEQASKTVQNMDGWEQLGLWGGLGMSALGLLHAMSGGGGIGSVIMSLLGLGVAGFTAGKAGLLDQGSQDLTQGLSDSMMGGSSPEISPTIKASLPTLLGDAKGTLGETAGGWLNSGRDAAANMALKQLATSHPQIAQQLDRAAGTGSWGNAALAQFGDMTGMRQNMMQDKLGLNPQQQDKLLKLWTTMRAAK